MPANFLNSKTAKAELAKTMAKGTSKAATATSPAAKIKQAAKIKEAKQIKSKLAAPSELARCREIVGGDLRGAVLLYRIAYLWQVINPKMQRNGQGYLAMTRADWAISAGLSDSELNKYALPRLRKYGYGIVTIQAMGNGKEKKLWVNLDPVGYQEALDKAGYELKVAALDAPILHP